MHLSSRMTLAVLAGVATVSLIFAIIQAASEVHTLRDEMQRQSLILAESQQQSVQRILETGTVKELQALVDQFRHREHLAGAAVYDPSGQMIVATSGTARPAGTPVAVSESLRTRQQRGRFFRLSGAPTYILALPVQTGTRQLGAFVIFHDAGYTAAPILRHVLTGVVQILLIVGITLLVIRWIVGAHIGRMTRWLSDLRAGRESPDGQVPSDAMFQPLASEVTRLATSLSEARAAAEEEARLRDASQAVWTSERLRVSLHGKLNGNRLLVVSNREPYEHTYHGGAISWRIPPSGLVTALEPILRVCDGIWVAQGTGNGDRDTADQHGRLRVPPDHPQYTLRRVWLSPEEEAGFYLGFANEGVWPLCHIAHTRPIFRADDWKHYTNVNRKFARSVLEEIESEKDPVVLVQDYHFALLPQMVKQERPDARVAIFWHIPWPNPEAFGICPWQREVLQGMLGADLIGFHIQAHCNNFLETVDRALESRIDREHFAVNRQDHITAVRPFPISIESGDGCATRGKEAPVFDRTTLFRQLGIGPAFLGLGVDRVDYTKGIPEKFRGIERFLEQYPEYQGELTFIQIGAPSRTHIKRYQDLMTEVEEEAERINRRFRSGSWKPILFLNRHHTHSEIRQYYLAADFCMVTSLHDGMNLVAKEYAAARYDEQGVLILSRFAGACHELADALIVNPYDTGELAASIYTALTMTSEEQGARMRRMREVIRQYNVYRWAENLIAELAGIRLNHAELSTKSGPLVLSSTPRL